MIALSLHHEEIKRQTEEARQTEHEKQYRAAVEKIGQGTAEPMEQKCIRSSYKEQYRGIVKHFAQSDAETMELKRIQVGYMKQYWEIVKHFSRQGIETMEMKRLMGDTSDGAGWQTPMTAEQIQQMREQLQTDQAQFAKDVDDTLLDRLRYENVMSQAFDAHVWI